VQLLRGSSLEMQLDRDLSFYADEVNFVGSASPSVPLPAPARGTINGDATQGGGSQFPYPRSFPAPF
jgi:hypothetical protein